MFFSAMRLPTSFSSPLTSVIAAAAVLMGCDNPADKTTDAKVGAARDAEGGVVEDAVKYVFTENAKIEFVGSKATGDSHTGGFKKFTGYFHVKDGLPVGTDHQVVIDMDSTFSDSEKLTGHLKNADFFDVSKFPTATFDGVEIKKEVGDAFTVTGNLNLHGVTKSVSFPATVTQTASAVRVLAEFDINRKDWGIVYGSTGPADKLIRDEVVLRFDLEAKAEG